MTSRHTSAPTTFSLSISGEIESFQPPQNRSYAPYYCQFKFIHGPDWAIQNGEDGICMTQKSSPSSYMPYGLHFDFAEKFPNEDTVVWNFPYDVAFQSQNAFGWPRLIVNVYGCDFFGRPTIIGYGSIHIPAQPGRHVRTIRLFRPIASSTFVRFMGWLVGKNPEFVDPTLAALPEGREVARVSTGGAVKVNFNVLVKDAQLFNYTM